MKSNEQKATTKKSRTSFCQCNSKARQQRALPLICIIAMPEQHADILDLALCQVARWNSEAHTHALSLARDLHITINVLHGTIFGVAHATAGHPRAKALLDVPVEPHHGA